MLKTTILALSCGVLLLSGCQSQPTSQPLEVGFAAPPLKLKTVSGGEEFDIDSMQGQVVVVNFWSTSCAVCLKEIDELIAIHESGKARVVGVALDEDAQNVQRVIQQHGVGYPVVLGDQEVFERFDGYSIPYTLVLDRSQVVRKRFFGRMTADQFYELLPTIDTPTQVMARHPS